MVALGLITDRAHS